MKRDLEVSALPPVGATVWLPQIDDISFSIDEVMLSPGSDPDYEIRLVDENMSSDFVDMQELRTYFLARGYGLY